MTLAITRAPWKAGMTPDEDDFETLFSEIEAEANGATLAPSRLTHPYSTIMVPLNWDTIPTSGTRTWKSTPDFAGVITKVTVAHDGAPADIDVTVTIGGVTVTSALTAGSSAEVSDAPGDAFTSGQQIVVTVNESGGGDADNVSVCLYLKALGRV